MKLDSKSLPMQDAPSSALLATAIPSDCSVEECQLEVRRILDNALFSGSRRLSEFVTFSTQAAVEGRLEVDQYEVAEQVLHRDQDFNPLDDASVRKVASQVRAKLEEYFEEYGRNDPILVSLPRRSYVLRFRRNIAATSVEDAAAVEQARSEAGGEAASSPTPQAPISSPPRSEEPAAASLAGEQAALKNAPAPATAAARPLLTRWVWAAGLVVVSMLAGAALYSGWTSLKHPATAAVPIDPGTAPAEFRILSQTGDVRGEGGEFRRGALLMGPSLDLDGDATVLMRFMPAVAGQHGGLMLFDNADNYVRFGSHFKVRSMLEFGHESRGVYSMPESSFQFDRFAQTGLPRWLSIRKQALHFSAFSSMDGYRWERFPSLQAPDPPLTRPVAGLYAFNGLTDSAEIAAHFRHLAVGLRFHQRPDGPVTENDFPGWRLGGTCRDASLVTVQGDAMQIDLPGDRLCGTIFERSWSAPAGEDWYVGAQIDFQAINGSSAGLMLRGEKGTLRLVRRDLNGASIMLERDLDRDVRMPDFPGVPPLFLRLTARDGYLTGSFSRDGEHYEEVPAKISLEELGPIRGYGVEAGLSHWLQVGKRPPVRVTAIEHGLQTLRPMESPSSSTRGTPAAFPAAGQ